MSLDPNPVDLEEYARLRQLRPRGRQGSGYFLNTSQRRLVTYSHNVRRMSAKSIYKSCFEGDAYIPLCTLRRVHDIIAQVREDPQRYVLGPSKRTGRP